MKKEIKQSVQTSIKIYRSTHRTAKILAAQTGMKMADILDCALASFLKSPAKSK